MKFNVCVRVFLLRIMYNSGAIYTVSQKRPTSHLWLAITLAHVNGFWYSFGRNVAHKVSKRRFTMPPQTTCASALNAKQGNAKMHFSLKCCISALSKFNQLLDFFNFLTILTLLYDSLKSCNQCVHSARGCWGAWFKINEVQSAAEARLCCMHNAPVRCLLGFLFRKVKQKH